MKLLFDTSALYKRYQQEPGREQVMALARQADEIIVAAHCKTEIASAINRQRHDGFVTGENYLRIMTNIHADFSEFKRVALDGRVELLAVAAMERVRLRAMDALHIGTALVASVDLFVTADCRQAVAARSAGLKTELIEA